MLNYVIKLNMMNKLVKKERDDFKGNDAHVLRHSNRNSHFTLDKKVIFVLSVLLFDCYIMEICLTLLTVDLLPTLQSCKHTK